MLGSLILYLKGMRRMMFQLSGFYCRTTPHYSTWKPPKKVLGLLRNTLNLTKTGSPESLPSNPLKASLKPSKPPLKPIRSLGNSLKARVLRVLGSWFSCLLVFSSVPTTDPDWRFMGSYK